MAAGGAAGSAWLVEQRDPFLSAFRPRSVQRLATTRRPRAMVDIECNHLLRTAADESVHGNPQVKYLLWLEAGKHRLPLADKPDVDYNSNMWRNFRRTYGFQVNSDGQRVEEMIACMYPLTIPPPSSIGSYTYARFLAESPLIANALQRKVAIGKTQRELRIFQELALMSDAKNPPLDTRGNILPPKNFRHYEARLVGPEEEDEEEDTGPRTPPYATRIDVLGLQVPLPKRGPDLWKLTHRVHNPQFQQLQERLRRRRAEPAPPPSLPSALSHGPAPLQAPPRAQSPVSTRDVAV